jgi:ribose 5-phosphate isomerase B
LVEEPVALKIVDIWLHTQFEGGRHQCRIEKIAELEREEYRQETGNKR